MTLHLRHRFKIRAFVPAGRGGGGWLLRECSFCGRLRETYSLHDWSAALGEEVGT